VPPAEQPKPVLSDDDDDDDDDGEEEEADGMVERGAVGMKGPAATLEDGDDNGRPTAGGKGLLDDNGGRKHPSTGGKGLPEGGE